MRTTKDANNTETELFLGSWAILIDYQYSLESANRSPKTIVEYLANLKRFFAFLSSKNKLKDITDISRFELRDYIQYLQQSRRWSGRPELGDMGSLSPASIQVHVRAIKAFFGWLLREEYIEKNPLEKFPLPRAPQKLITTLSPAQVKMLLSAIDRITPTGARNYLIILLLFDGGFRISELLNIKIEDIDFDAGFVRVTGKGRKERLIPLSRLTLREISRYINRRQSVGNNDKSSYLFAINGREPITQNGIQQMLHRLRDQAGLRGIKMSAHTFRHSFATEFIAAGANVFALKEILGHASLQTTLKYTHLRPADIRKEHEKYSPMSHLFKR